MGYKTFWEEKGIKWIFSGSLTNDDLYNCNMDLYKDSRFLDIEYELCDFTAVESFPVDSEVIVSIGKMDMEQSKINQNVKIAIISDEAVMRGLSNMYEAASYNSPWETQLFENEEDARAWTNA
jgi:hypothetical protein